MKACCHARIRVTQTALGGSHLLLCPVAGSLTVVTEVGQPALGGRAWRWQTQTAPRPAGRACPAATRNAAGAGGFPFAVLNSAP
jgi:hypothetical protein